MKFPQDDILILAAGLAFFGIIFFLYRTYKNRKAIANLSVAAGTLEEQLVNLNKNFYEIGREEKTEMIQINSRKVSRQHAFINKKVGKFYLTDNNSTNGTFLNEQKLQPNHSYLLTNQDEIRIGGVILKFYDLSDSKKHF
jgi:pSer/pThr/pTyr-binding forkhead associated (FHA) protein